jgi:hypothetical protein
MFRARATMLFLITIAAVTAHPAAAQKSTAKSKTTKKPTSPAKQAFPLACDNGSAPQFPNQAASTKPATIDTCGLSGSAAATSADGKQNIVKNNFCAVGTPTPVKTSDMASLQASVEKIPGFPKGTPPANRSALTKLGEGDAVVFEGFVFEARQECKESVNCGTAMPNVNASHDIHISLLDDVRKTKESDPQPKRDAEECTAFVAEMTPHHRPAQWTACSVNAVAAQGLRVRVTGQRSFDGSHLPCKNGAPQGSNPKRISLWEIHPIYKFEVCPKGNCAAGGWMDLADFAKNMPKCPEKNCK